VSNFTKDKFVLYGVWWITLHNVKIFLEYAVLEQPYAGIFFVTSTVEAQSVVTRDTEIIKLLFNYSYLIN
jgi:hypothetical protein